MPVDTSLLYPPFKAQIEELLKLRPDFVLTQGFRSFSEQLKLWSQGRTAPGRIVTNAGPGDSSHNYGLAVDFVHIVKGHADWSAIPYSALGPVTRSLGLVWGGDWQHKDLPHVQWPGYVTASQLAPLKAIKQEPNEPTIQWLQRVWKLLT